VHESGRQRLGPR